MEVAHHCKDFGHILRVRERFVYSEESGFLLTLREKKNLCYKQVRGKERKQIGRNRNSLGRSGSCRNEETCKVPGVFLEGRLRESTSGFSVGCEGRTEIRDDFAHPMNNFQTEVGLAKMGASGREADLKEGAAGNVKGELPPDIQVEMLCRRVAAGARRRASDLGCRLRCAGC